jgi:DNA-binding NarL/FixJ family response regulator
LGTTAAAAESAVAALQAPAIALLLVDFGLPDPAPGGLLDAKLGAALGRIIDAARAHQGAVMLVSGRHADNTIELSLLGCQGQLPALRDRGSVVDLGPTLLARLGLNRAAEVQGESLLAV